MRTTLSRPRIGRYSLAVAILLMCHVGLSLAQSEGPDAPAKEVTDAAATNAAVEPSTSPPSADTPADRAASPSSTDISAEPSASPSSATDASNPSDPTEQIIVSGEQPGPGLWKVSHGDHVLWIISSISPAPRDMKWRSREVETVVASSKVVLSGANVSPNIGIFRGMRYLPALLRARFNPDKAVLKDLISPELYARWLPLRKEYFKDDDDVEKLRPMLIALGLYSKAIEKAGLSERPVVAPVVFKTAKKHKVPSKVADIKVDVDNPKQLIKDFTETSRDVELTCFIGALNHLTADIEAMRLRANAWAVGDVETFRALPRPIQYSECIKAVTSAPGLQDEFGNIQERVNVTWQANAEAALAANDVSVALMSMDDVLREGGALAKLRARGYTVESPDAASGPAPGPADSPAVQPPEPPGAKMESLSGPPERPAPIPL